MDVAREVGRTARYAIRTWGRTLRLCALLLVGCTSMGMCFAGYLVAKALVDRFL